MQFVYHGGAPPRHRRALPPIGTSIAAIAIMPRSSLALYDARDPRVERTWRTLAGPAPYHQQLATGAQRIVWVRVQRR